MVLAAIFNDDNKNTLENTRKKTKKGHSPRMLLPVLDDLNDIANKGHFIAIGGKVYSFRAFVACVPMHTVESPNLFRTKGHKSLCHCPICLFTGVRVSSTIEHYFKHSSRCTEQVNIFDRQAYNLHLRKVQNGNK